MALLPVAQKNSGSRTQSCTLVTTGVTFRLAYQKQSKKPFHKNFRKNNTVREVNGHNRFSALNLYPILPNELWNKTMFAMSGVLMVIKMIYLLTFWERVIEQVR